MTHSSSRSAKPPSLRAHPRRIHVRGVQSGRVTVLFNEQLRPGLMQFIRSSRHLVGCVAWATDRELLDLMSNRRRVSLIVQNEEVLRGAGVDDARLRESLARLRNDWTAGLFGSGPLTSAKARWPADRPVPGLASVGPAVRIDGRHARDLMHHKFLVRLEEGARGRLRPAAVWTGSMNFSANGSKHSLENATIINDPRVARAYCAEWQSVLAMAEPVALPRPGPRARRR